MTQGDLVDGLPDVTPWVYGSDPHYRGYRVDPQASAEEAVWFFGCSMVWGYELPPHKTVVSLLKKATNLNVVNLGVNSAGTAWVRLCIERLLAQGHRPKAVIIAWPGFSRWLSWNVQDNHPVFWAGWSLSPSDPRSKVLKNHYPEQFYEFKKLFLEDRLTSISQVDRLETLRLLKKYSIPYMEFGYYYTFEDLLPLGVNIAPEPEDYTEDGWHPGATSQLKTALWIKNQLSSLGWLSSS